MPKYALHGKAKQSSIKRQTCGWQTLDFFFFFLTSEKKDSFFSVHPLASLLPASPGSPASPVPADWAWWQRWSIPWERSQGVEQNSRKSQSRVSWKVNREDGKMLLLPRTSKGCLIWWEAGGKAELPSPAWPHPSAEGGQLPHTGAASLSQGWSQARTPKARCIFSFLSFSCGFRKYYFNCSKSVWADETHWPWMAKKFCLCFSPLKETLEECPG